ncbi:protein OXIDATIVE STRESS 3-like [Actinidia eriantha]|uniref:protein OXIDATIVE STRESS 3-like n=1 Tax=Actinidia eriantha TaxID=165200 RepID=UPI0025847136|nr:protein OXIDATIVE STRESS 3-like [Actinidia eriantha]
MRMGPSSSFNQQSNHGTMDELGAEADVDVDSISSCSSRVSSVESSDSSDLMDEATSSLSPSPPPSSSSASTASPLHDMSALMNQLPLKRGLSKHFQGKSQSFTSLSNVRCLEDLAKPENPYHKKLRSCKSYGGLSSSLLHRTLSSSRFVPKKASNSRVSCSSLGAKRTPSFLGNKPPMPPPHRANRTPLFA